MKDRIKISDDLKLALGVHRFKVTEVNQILTQPHCEWEGKTKDGNIILIKYKWAKLSIRIKKDGTEGKEIVSVMYGKDLLSSYITLKQVAKLSEDRLDFSNVLDL